MKNFKCFKQYEYTLVVLEDIEVENFGDDEVRIDLEFLQNKVEVYYTRMTKEYITDEVQIDGRYGASPIRHFAVKNI